MLQGFFLSLSRSFIKPLQCFFAFVFIGACLIAAEAPPRKSAKLLTVGNSFADNVTAHIAEFAKAGNKELVLFRANLGGHSLDQHVGYLQAYEANANDPVGHAYKGRQDPKTKEKKDFSLKEALTSETWDYVTIQQVSHKSYKPETYQPYADILINYIKKHAPQAEILVHETWSYREDHHFFKDGSLTPQAMYEGLKAAYEKLASDYKLRIIPSGDAVQAARALPRWTFKFPDPDFDYKNPPKDQVPKQPGSLFNGWVWRKNSKNPDQLEFAQDAIHLNKEGCYLVGAVLYEVIYNDSVENNSFVPSGISEEDAKMFRAIAHEAVAARKK